MKNKIARKKKKGNVLVIPSVKENTAVYIVAKDDDIKIITKPYYSQPKFTLYNADCLKVLAEIKENSIDMIFADPPYFLSSGTFTCQNGKMVSVKKGEWDLSKGLQENFDFHLAWIKSCRRVLKPNGTIWISGTYHSIYQCGYALQLAGYHILNDIAWFKPNASPNLSCRFFTASHETIIWARKDKKAKHIFNYDAMKNGDWAEDQIKKPGLPTLMNLGRKYGWR